MVWADSKDNEYWNGLTSKQQGFFIKSLRNFDLMMLSLLESAKDSDGMKRPTEKLSSNLDFKARAKSYLHRVAAHLDKGGVNEGIVCNGVCFALLDLNKIVPGQPRADVRYWINEARITFLCTMSLDDGDPIYDFELSHPSIPIGHKFRWR